MNLSNEHIITLFKNHSDNFRFNIKEQSLLIELLNVEIESYKKDNLETDLLENILFKLKLNNNEDIIKEYYKRDITECHYEKEQSEYILEKRKNYISK
tara:strand:+ start:406 stop:699 length:294 start_codon:yes stop_codon:yes gene_type:complete